MANHKQEWRERVGCCFEALAEAFRDDQKNPIVVRVTIHSANGDPIGKVHPFDRRRLRRVQQDIGPISADPAVAGEEIGEGFLTVLTAEAFKDTERSLVYQMAMEAKTVVVTMLTSEKGPGVLAYPISDRTRKLVLEGLDEMRDEVDADAEEDEVEEDKPKHDLAGGERDPAKFDHVESGGMMHFSEDLMAEPKPVGMTDKEIRPGIIQEAVALAYQNPPAKPGAPSLQDPTEDENPELAGLYRWQQWARNLLTKIGHESADKAPYVLRQVIGDIVEVSADYLDEMTKKPETDGLRIENVDKNFQPLRARDVGPATVTSPLPADKKQFGPTDVVFLIEHATRQLTEALRTFKAIGLYVGVVIPAGALVPMNDRPALLPLEPRSLAIVHFEHRILRLHNMADGDDVHFAAWVGLNESEVLSIEAWSLNRFPRDIGFKKLDDLENGYGQAVGELTDKVPLLDDEVTDRENETGRFVVYLAGVENGKLCRRYTLERALKAKEDAEQVHKPAAVSVRDTLKG